jgi:hypothetical protein
LTPPTRDGGYDIIAVSKDKSGLETTWLVECKRYKPDHKVGVEIARGLQGVKTHLGVPNAILISTSGFTAGARELSKSRYNIQLIDYDKLLQWIRDYTSPPGDVAYSTARTFYSCFICHSHKDQEFAEKLAARLRTQGIRVWFSPEDILPGQKIYDQVKRAINSFDKLLIVLSTESMRSEWVKTEIRTARKRELEEGRQVLFPVSIASIDDIKSWECFEADTGRDLAVEVREYFIPDFSDWKNPQKFEAQIEKIIWGLSAADEDRKRVQ